MSTFDDHAGRVWERILPEIRTTRRRRGNRRVPVILVAACVLAGAWLAMRTGPAPQTPVVHAAAEPAVVETLAVMRVGDDGTVRLEELPTDQLGAVELAFGMTPVVSDNPPEW